MSNPEAGLELVRRVKAKGPDMPLLMQSTNVEILPAHHRPLHGLALHSGGGPERGSDG